MATLHTARTGKFSLLIADIIGGDLHLQKKLLALDTQQLPLLLPQLPLFLPDTRCSGSIQKSRGTTFRRSLGKLTDELSRHHSANTIILFGAMSDPFSPFENAFDLALKVTESFARFLPKKLFIQSRSPLLSLLFPILKSLGKRVCITMALETNNQDIADRYTPHLPLVAERIETAKLLRSLEVDMLLQVAPLLPLSDAANAASQFATILRETSTSMYVKPLAWFLSRVLSTNCYKTLSLQTARMNANDPYTKHASTLLIEELKATASNQLLYRSLPPQLPLRTEPVRI